MDRRMDKLKIIFRIDKKETHLRAFWVLQTYTIGDVVDDVGYVEALYHFIHYCNAKFIFIITYHELDFVALRVP